MIRRLSYRILRANDELARLRANFNLLSLLRTFQVDPVSDNDSKISQASETNYKGPRSMVINSG